MAIINYSDQLKFTGKGYLDAKMMPVEKFSDLKNISITQRFEGLTVTVLKDENNNSNPQDYWLIGGVTNSCWIPKTTSGYNNDLKLILEDGFLKLMNGEEQLGDEIDLNSFFPTQPDEPDFSNDMYISSVDYASSNDNSEQGVFLCFTYSNGDKKYLDMSQFLSKTYEQGSGIVIEGNLISLDSAVLGRIETLEKNFEEEKIKHETSIGEVKLRIDGLVETINKNTKNIEDNKTEINTLTERVNALSSASEGSTPDGETIGITDDEKKALYVKVLNKDGNILKVDTHEGEKGLFASIPVFFEDDELNNI